LCGIICNMNGIEQSASIEKENQVIEGRIDDLVGFESGDWKKILPQGLTLSDVDLFLKSESGGKSWYWHLKSECIKDKEEKDK